MAIRSYNEVKENKIALQHMFLPGGYSAICEGVIAILALVLFNLSTLNDQILSKDTGTTNPLSLWPEFIKHLLEHVEKYSAIQQIVLFSLWAIVGALLYILVFRLIQIAIGVRRSIKLGVRYVRQDPNQGAFRWLASLHDFFVKALVVCAGTAALAIGALVCFGIASQELNNSLASTFPRNIGQLSLSLIAAILSVRIIVLGVTLLSSRFRSWYLY